MLNLKGLTKLVLASLVRVATVGIIVAQLNFGLSAKILMLISLSLLAILASSLAHGLAILFASLGIVTILQIILERVFAGITLPLTVHSIIIFILSVLLLALANPRSILGNINYQSISFEFLSVLVSTFLFRNLIISGGVDHLTLLKPEDNIPWIARAREILTSNEIAGVVSDGGGHTFSHVLALVAQLKNTDESHIGKLVSSLETIVITYQLLGIFGLLFIGHFALNLLKRFKSSAIIAALCTQILAFKLLFPLIASEGHLTLVMAIIFCWLFLFLTEYFTSEISKLYLVMSISIVSLISGSWWPLAPVSISAIAVLLRHFYKYDTSKSFRYLRLFSFCLIFIAIAAVFARYKTLFLTLDFQSFLRAGGSFTESQPLMTATSIYGLYMLYSALCISSEQKSSWLIVLSIPGSLLIFGILLSQATFFVGPSFSQSDYSAGKLLYAGVAVVLPTVISTVAFRLYSEKKFSAGVSSLLLLSTMGAVFFGNNVLDGRFNTVESAWSASFLQEKLRSPDAIIVCNSENDIEAYLCTKTSRYVYQGSDSGGFQAKWGDFQLSPIAGTSLSDALASTLRDDPRKDIVVISLEPALTVQEVDRQQFSLLPWSQIRVVDAKSGQIIEVVSPVFP